MSRSSTLAGVLATATVFSVLTGCSAGTTAAEGVAYVVGARSNSAAPDFDAIADRVPLDLAVGSIVTITGVSGGVNGVAGHGFTVADYGNSVDNADAVLGQKGQLDDDLAAVPADVGEADVLGAIAAAARTLSGVPGDRTLIVADSMVSTAGALPFQSGLLTADAADVAASIVEDQLPPLEGFTVLIVGQGVTSAPQEPLGQSDQTALRSIWEAVLLRAGAVDITYDDTSRSTTASPGVPAVTLVDPTPPTVVEAAGCTAVVPEHLIRFEPDRPDFVDLTTATLEIAKVAASLSGCEGTITVAGTTADANPDEEFNRRLSRDRAIAVRALLAADLGIPEDEILVEGLGSEFPGFVPDHNPDGSLNPVLAAANRTVIITFDEH